MISIIYNLLFNDQSNQNHLVTNDQSNQNHLVTNDQSNRDHLVINDQSNHDNLPDLIIDKICYYLDFTSTIRDFRHIEEIEKIRLPKNIYQISKKYNIKRTKYYNPFENIRFNRGDVNFIKDANKMRCEANAIFTKNPNGDWWKWDYEEFDGHIPVYSSMIYNPDIEQYPEFEYPILLFDDWLDPEQFEFDVISFIHFNC